jgi:LysM repeat protein
MQRKSTPVILINVLCLSVLWFMSRADSASAAPKEQTPAPAGGAPVILAAGDIAQCNTDRDSLTAYLLEINQGAILSLGDHINLGATPQDFQNCFAPTWGRHFDRIYPTPGNHDYDAQGAAGYFGYFGDKATPLEPGCTRDCKGYYSFDLGAWHIVAINSEVSSHAGTEQEQWLRADLAAHLAQCILAFWHRARISSSRNALRGPEGPWQALYDYGADVVLSGHDHLYERFMPLNPALEPDPEHGIRQFIVGTGGHDHFDFRNILPVSEVRDNEAWGVLKLTLHPDSYDWEFLPIPGQTFTDKGSAPCSTPKNPPVYTTANTAPAASAGPAASVSPAAGIPTGGVDYTIRAGDTLGAIGARYGLDWSVLATANGLGAYSILEVGQVIRIPGVDEEIAPQAATGRSAATTVAAQTTGAAVPQPVQSASNAGKYTVQAGDTLFALALRFGVTQVALAQANSLSNADLLQIGQVLLIPGAAGTDSTQARSTAPIAVASAVTPTTAASPAVAAVATPAPAAGVRMHTVVSGDTVISIAIKYNLDWRQLLMLNGLNENSILQIGQKLRIE